EALIVGKSADEVRLRACFDHLQFVVSDDFFLEALDLYVDRIGHLLWRMSGQRERVERKQVWILGTRQSTETCGEGCYLFVANQGAVQARGAPFRQQIGDRIEHRIVF